MKANELFLRCFAEHRHGLWQAFCVDLNLAAQGESFDEVRQKLEEQINEYVRDVLVGEDRQFADQLLTRKAPLSIRSRYWFYRAVCALDHARWRLGRVIAEPKLFIEQLPLEPHRPRMA